MGAFFERIAMSSRLSPEDQQRVEQYLSAPQHQVERQPFRPWRLLLIVIALTIGLGLFSRLLVGLAL
ncbi:hypothetical protein OH686_16455 [Pseudomonas sp. SO81]|jgi:hypothetical protein|nr:hypothetical protein OH686_16455 [Pseudomonas sp. SO81]